jgi:hypothetical protein
MHQIVSQQFRKFSATLEGDVTWMYLDVKGLVTTGRGNLIDPADAALKLQWQYRDRPGTLVSDPRAEVTEEWNRIKNSRESKALQGHGGGHYKSITTLDVTAESLDHLFDAMLVSNETTLKNLRHLSNQPYADFEDWPADAQLGLLSMAWAMGGNFTKVYNYHKFDRAVMDCDWEEAAEQSHISEANNAPIWKRNVANKVLFRNAAVVEGGNLAFDVLYYPTTLFGPPTAQQTKVLSEF